MTSPCIKDADDDDAAEIVFLTMEATARRIGVSLRTLYNMMEAGEFPRPVTVHKRRKLFVESEVTAWQREKIAERRS